MNSQDNKDGTETAIGVLTNMIGALTMSRMVDDPALSERILKVTRRRIANAFNASSSKPSAAVAKRAVKPENKRARSKMQ
jgi:hypothetical protein